MDGEQTLDDVLVSAVPRSEMPAFDLCLHGGVRVVERALQLLGRHGATFSTSDTPAASTWVTRNRIEAEAIAALLTARTTRAAACLAWQRLHLPAVLTRLADRAGSDHDSAAREWTALLKTSERARFLFDGGTVGIVGPPNSGKSTLFNRIVGRDAVVVSPTPGTTRDWVSAELDIEGLPVTLVDTAGRHDTADDLERDAIRLGIVRTESMDAVITVLDGSAPLGDDARATLAWGSGRRGLVALNKTDLGAVVSAADPAIAATAGHANVVTVSARTGEGVALLLERLARVFEPAGPSDGAQAVLFTGRQLATARRLTPLLETDPRRFSDEVRVELVGQ